MRTIKFRGFCLDREEWVYGDLLQHRVLPVIFDKDKEQNECNAKSIGMFTGLLDRHGKEIYEGDIVKFLDYCGNKEETFENIQPVIWWDEMAEFTIKNTFVDLNFTTIDDIEIIGNIYQNPDLLNKEQ